MSKFKIGDRVRRTKPSDWPWQFGEVGKEYTVLAVPHGESIVVIEGMPGANASLFELVTPALTLTVGKFYRTSAGDVAGPVSQGDIGFEAYVNGKVRVFDGAGGAVFDGDDIVEEWVPKVGERVRFTIDNPNGGKNYGEAGEIVEVSRAREENAHYGPQVAIALRSFDWHPSAPISALEPLPVAAPAQPATVEQAKLRIEAGRYYKTRDGRKVGPIWHKDGDSGHFYWKSESADIGGYFPGWCENGSFYTEGETSLDLVAEWVDEPVSAPVAAQVDAIAEEYGPVVREPRPWDRYSERAETSDNTPATFTISLDTGNMHEELDELIAKLKKVRKLQRQVGLAA